MSLLFVLLAMVAVVGGVLIYIKNKKRTKVELKAEAEIEAEYDEGDDD